MSHNDAHSPAGSYTAGFNRELLHSSPGPKVESVTPAELKSPLSSSLERSALLSSLIHGSHPSVYTAFVFESYPCFSEPDPYFFEPETENVDTNIITHHAARLSKAGVTGITTQGSNGEAVHLTHSERQLVATTTRKALNENGFSHMPVIVGCGFQSTRETIKGCREAWEAGGDYALVLPPSYYATCFAKSTEATIQHFTTVADASPIPIIIYNFPGALGGMDLTSNVITSLAEHPKIVGVKFTCGNTGKLNRVADGTRKSKNYAPSRPDFLILVGSADFLMQSCIARSHGILADLANITKLCVKTLELFNEDRFHKAQGDWATIYGGVLNYGSYARSPLPRPTTFMGWVRSWRMFEPRYFRTLAILRDAVHIF